MYGNLLKNLNNWNNHKFICFPIFGVKTEVSFYFGLQKKYGLL